MASAISMRSLSLRTAYGSHKWCVPVVAIVLLCSRLALTERPTEGPSATNLHDPQPQETRALPTPRWQEDLPEHWSLLQQERSPGEDEDDTGPSTKKKGSRWSMMRNSKKAKKSSDTGSSPKKKGSGWSIMGRKTVNQHAAADTASDAERERRKAIPPTPGLPDDFDMEAFDKFQPAQVTVPELEYKKLWASSEGLEEQIDGWGTHVNGKLEDEADNAMDTGKKSNKLVAELVSKMNRVNENRVTQNNKFRESRMGEINQFLEEVADEDYDGLSKEAPTSLQGVADLLAKAREPVAT